MRQSYLKLIRFDMRDALPIGAGLAVSLLLRIGLIYYGNVPFNGDEAVVALMARHILNGERPIFFYGQSYMGSLDAYLVAGMFRLFGESVISIRLMQTFLYLLFTLTLVLLANTLFVPRQIGLFSAWIAAIPAVVVTTYTIATLGGYVESLILGNIVLIVGYKILSGEWSRSIPAWISLGLVAGLGLWTLGIIVIYLIPVVILLLTSFELRKVPNYVVAFIGFFIGSTPWWVYNLDNAWKGLFVAGEPVAVLEAGKHLFGLVFLGLPAIFGLRFPWTPEFAPFWLLIVGVILYITLFYQLRIGFKNKISLMRPGGKRFLLYFSIGYLVLFLGTRFGIDATGRYQLPIYLLSVFLIAVCVWIAYQRRSILGIFLLISVLLFNGIQTFRASVKEEGLTTQFGTPTRFGNRNDEALIAFLRSHGETRGYTNYWVSYRLAFLSGEDIIFVPKLPYREDLKYAPSDNRYAPYQKIVSGSQKTAFITTNNQALDERLSATLTQLEISFLEKQIGVYHVYYQLSQAVHPEQLDLGIQVQ